jgi:hypothetical protein
MALTDRQKQLWFEESHKRHQQEKQEDDRILAVMQSAFSGFEPTLDLKSTQGKGYGIVRQFNRRSWQVELFEKHSGEWHAGIYIKEHTRNYGYFWERATGKTVEEAIDRLKLRIQAVQQEINAITGEQ